MTIRSGVLAPGANRLVADAVRTGRVLYWIYGARLVLCLAIYGSALVVGDLWPGTAGALPPETRTISLLGLLLAGVVTPIAYWHSHHRDEDPSHNFLYMQALLDVLLITGVVHITGGSGSLFPPLFYIAFASGYALVLPFASAVLVALLSGVFYLLDITLAYPPQLEISVLLQIGIFTGVASVSSVIGARLRQVRDELRTLEGELHRLRLDTTDVLRTIDSAVVTLDDEGRVAYMNPAAEELMGVDAGHWLGRPFLSELETRAPGVARAVRETLRTGSPVRNREAVITRDGSGPIPVSISNAPLREPEAESSVTVVLQDLRPVRQLEELRLRAGRLEAVTELSASLAHEIRNPLASIRSAIEQLSQQHEDEDDRMLARLIVRESDRLDRLLGEFGDFARVDVAERKPLDFPRMIRRAVEMVEQHPDARDELRIEVRVDGDTDGTWGDAELLHRALVNLLLNAAQVTASLETPRVRVDVDTLTAEGVPVEMRLGSPVRIRISDNGPGIEEEARDRIFDPFYSRREGGSGMGLSVAHRAVQAHGGALMVRSTPGEGATFLIVLPRRGEERSSRATEEELPERKVIRAESGDEERIARAGVNDG